MTTKIFIVSTLLLFAFNKAPLNMVKPQKEIIMEKVTFNVEGLNLVGNLYLPADFDENNTYPAVVTGGSLTSVKEQMAGTYAKKLAEEGIVALAFDYRNFGESEGSPRQFEDPELKLQDLKAAVSFLTSLPYVKSVGGLGICTSGGNMAYLAAEDKRVKAIATVAAWLPNQETLPMLYGSEENIEALRTKGEAAKEKFALTGTNTIIPAYHNVDQTASHVGPMEYYMDEHRGGGVQEWKNEFAVMSWLTWLDFNPMDKAAAITAPVMIVHSDNSALPNNAKQFFEALQGEKELVWGEGYHFDYYDQPEQVNASAKKVSTFFLEKL